MNEEQTMTARTRNALVLVCLIVSATIIGTIVYNRTKGDGQREFAFAFHEYRVAMGTLRTKGLEAIPAAFNDLKAKELTNLEEHARGMDGNLVKAALLWVGSESKKVQCLAEQIEIINTSSPGFRTPEVSERMKKLGKDYDIHSKASESLLVQLRALLSAEARSIMDTGSPNPSSA